MNNKGAKQRRRGRREEMKKEEKGPGGKAEMLVRSEKSCVTEGESPPSLEAKPPEFGTKVMNGKV